MICKEVSSDIPELKPSFRPFTANIASERIDLIIAAAAGCNRETASKLLKNEKVFINGKIVSSAGHKLQPRAEIVIRGYGKFIYDGIAGNTKKGRLNIQMRQYI